MFSQKQTRPTRVPSTTTAPSPLPSASKSHEPNLLAATRGGTPPIASREGSVELIDIAVDVGAPIRKQKDNIALVDSLKQLAKKLRDDIHQRAADISKPDPLACFNIDPASFDDKTVSADELWEEVLNSLMKNALGWGTTLDVPSLVETDGQGVMGLARFVEYFVVERGVSEVLFEGKLNHLMSGLRSL